MWSAFLALDEAFVRGDVRGRDLAGFVDDADLTLWRSSEVEHAVGPEELRRFATRMAAFRGRSRSTTTSTGCTSRDEVAWLNAAGTGTWDDGAGTVKQMPHRVTAVFRRVDGAWRCHTRNGSQPRVVKFG